MTEPTAPQNSGPRSNPSFVVGALYASVAVTLLWWALAFLPLPVPDPVLYNLRSVCFGTLPNGLPDTWGWLLLALSPVSIFGFLIAVWSDEIGPSLQHSLRNPLGKIVFAVALLSTIGTFGYAGYRVVTIKLAEKAGSELDMAGEMPEDYPRTHKPAPDFTLINQYGAAVTLSSLRGSTVILTFAYAHCATVCPTIIHAARNGATQARQLTTNPVVLVFITLDPWRDTVSALPSLAEAWQLGADMQAHLLSGEVDTVMAALQAYDIPTARDQKSGEISHPSIAYVISPEGTIEYTLSNPTPAWIAQSVQRVSR